MILFILPLSFAKSDYFAPLVDILIPNYESRPVLNCDCSLNLTHELSDMAKE